MKLNEQTPSNYVRQELITYKRVNGKLYRETLVRTFYETSFVDTLETICLENN